jgi:hypothetical protein
MNFDGQRYSGNNRVAYLRTKITVPSAQELGLEVGAMMRSRCG